jgi:hypothetical protein
MKKKGLRAPVDARNPSAVVLDDGEMARLRD